MYNLNEINSNNFKKKDLNLFHNDRNLKYIYILFLLNIDITS